MGNVFVHEQDPRHIRVARVYVPPEPYPSFSHVSQRFFTPEMIANTVTTLETSTHSYLEVRVEKSKTMKVGYSATHMSWNYFDDDHAHVCIELLHPLYNPLKLPTVAVNGQVAPAEWVYSTRSTAMIINKRHIQITIGGGTAIDGSSDGYKFDYILHIDGQRVSDPNESANDVVLKPPPVPKGSRNRPPISPRTHMEPSAPLLLSHSDYVGNRGRSSSLTPRSNQAVEYIF